MQKATSAYQPERRYDRRMNWPATSSLFFILCNPGHPPTIFPSAHSSGQEPGSFPLLFSQIIGYKKYLWPISGRNIQRDGRERIIGKFLRAKFLRLHNRS